MPRASPRNPRQSLALGKAWPSAKIGPRQRRPRQSWSLGHGGQDLVTIALGKELFKKNLHNFFAEGRWWRPSAKICSPRQRIFWKKFWSISLPRAMGRRPRQRLHPRKRRRHSYFSLPRANLVLGKDFAECPIKDPRQRLSLPTQNFPRALC